MSKTTMHRIDMNIADSIRGYYEDHSLTLAKHPSETNQRLLLRVAAFAMNAHERLQPSKSLSDADEPDLWQIGLTGEIEHWIELGQPQDKRLRQACSKSQRVSIYTYQRGAGQNWYAGIEETAQRFKHLRVIHFDCGSQDPAYDRLVERTMNLGFLIDEQQILISANDVSLTIPMKVLKDFSP